jgi:hypothetical protein
MEQFEKVVKGLECCLPETQEQAELSCADCPYDPCGHSVSLPISLIDDARKLITAQRERIKELEAAQTARVMSLEELEDALDTVVWVEEPEFENFADHYALIMAYSHKVGFVRVSFGFAEMPVDCEYEYEDYGKKWRCWTQRPTDEQRKAVPWNG